MDQRGSKDRRYHSINGYWDRPYVNWIEIGRRVLQEQRDKQVREQLELNMVLYGRYS